MTSLQRAFDINWRSREQKRFKDGTYKPVTWTDQGWWDDKGHFVRISPSHPEQIEYVRCERDGAVDKPTTIKPGRYLTRYFGEKLTPEQIREFAVKFSLPKELKFARTPEEIQKAYVPYLGSCFAGSENANVYGAGDFAVAYVEDKEGKIIARTVCVPERKIWCRIYGDKLRLQTLLEKEGYRLGEYNSARDWAGLRLSKKWWWNGFYSDFGRRYEPHPTDPNCMITV